MGCAASYQDIDPAATLRNNEINKELEQERKLIEKELLVKLLLLGPSESGKSTIVKQMSLIYGSGFSSFQTKTFREAIHMNLFTSIITLINAMETLQIPYGFKQPENQNELTLRLAETTRVLLQNTNESESSQNSSWGLSSAILPAYSQASLDPRYKSTTLHHEEGTRKKLDDPIAELAAKEYRQKGGRDYQKHANAALATMILSLNATSHTFNTKAALNSKYITAIKELWKDPGVQYCFSRANEFQIVDSCAYVMTHIDRFSDPLFHPTDDDILVARVTTTGSCPLQSMMLAVNAVNDGKWAQFFEDSQSIIFLVAISAYDQVCMEDEETNRIVEAMNLFASICNNPLFKKTDMILFLNKIDLFQEKIKARPISLYFPDYVGPNEYQESSKYFVNRFKEINKYPDSKKIYPHLTHATDTKQTKKIMKSAIESIKQTALKKMDEENF
ncbi:guanine nucleotide binding protein, alpha subunit [Obelidium mucronatum]|nr:guanine nucleotide binding protein, alpha subunit [Obelidium mucronatum]